MHVIGHKFASVCNALIFSGAISSVRSYWLTIRDVHINFKIIVFSSAAEIWLVHPPPPDLSSTKKLGPFRVKRALDPGRKFFALYFFFLRLTLMMHVPRAKILFFTSTYVFLSLIILFLQMTGGCYCFVYTVIIQAHHILLWCWPQKYLRSLIRGKATFQKGHVKKNKHCASVCAVLVALVWFLGW